MGDISAEYLSAEEFNEYCKFIADGATTRQAAEKSNKNRPSIFMWLSVHATKEQQDQYARAMEVRADALFEQCLDIADDDNLDVGFKPDGTPFVDHEHIQRSRLRVDTRKWVASKMNPKKYGDKVTQEISGPGGGPIVSRATTMSEDELNSRIIELATKAGAAGVDGITGREPPKKD